MRTLPTLALLAALALAGCAAPSAQPDDLPPPVVAPPDGGAPECDAYPMTMLRVKVIGLAGDLARIALLDGATRVVPGPCPGPPGSATLVATGAATAAGLVASDTYREVHVHHAAGMHRLALDLDATEGGDVELVILEDRVVALRHGVPVPVARAESFDDARALDPLVTREDRIPLTDGVARSFTLDVASPWNEGIVVELGIARAAAGDAEPNGARIEVRVVAPDGSVVARRSLADAFGETSFVVPAEVPGAWRVQVETWEADARDAPGAFVARASLAY